MNNPLVSVIINCFNGEKYLKKCIQSIINQTYKNFEIIFWDNNSKDQSKNILFEFSDSRIRYFKTNTKYNLGESRNKAIEKSKGELIAFLDIDDWYVPEKLYLQVKEFQANKDIGLIYTNYYIFYDLSKKRKIFKCKILIENISQHLLDNYNIGILTVMIKRNLLIKNKFNSHYNFIEDFDLVFKLSLQTKFKFIDLPTAYYRIHSNNLSKKLLKYAEELKKWIKLNKISFKNNLSFKNLETKIKLIEIKNDILKGNKIRAIKKMISSNLYKNYATRLNYLISIFLPTFLIKKIINKII